MLYPYSVADDLSDYISNRCENDSEFKAAYEIESAILADASANQRSKIDDEPTGLVMRDWEGKEWPW